MGADAANNAKQNGDVRLNQSISTLVCLANNHQNVDKEYNVPFCVATVDRDEETTYQLIGFGDICQKPGYKLQGYLSHKYVSDFATAYWPKIGNAQFRDVELIPCSVLGIEEEFTNLKDVYFFSLLPFVISAMLFYRRAEKLAKTIFALGSVSGLVLLFLDISIDKYINEKRRQRIHDLLSGN